MAGRRLARPAGGGISRGRVGLLRGCQRRNARPAGRWSVRFRRRRGGQIPRLIRPVKPLFAGCLTGQSFPSVLGLAGWLRLGRGGRRDVIGHFWRRRYLRFQDFR